jgi:hypothetical protein
MPETLTSTEPKAEPRWPAVLGLLAIGGVYLSLPERLTFGPNWLVLAIIAVLLVPTIAFHRAGSVKLSFWLGVLLSAIVTAAIAFSLGALIAGLPDKRQPPAELLRSAAALWAGNVLVFASWYWRLDAGGPTSRDRRHTHTEGAFLFPQMTQHNPIVRAWKPGFVDYLFLAFNTSTAFSPTDVPVLSRWAKALMMVQSCISLGTIAILAARAINVL